MADRTRFSERIGVRKPSTIVQLDEASGSLRVLAEKTRLHGALVKGFKSLYGYTSDKGGVRHAVLEQPNVGLDETKLMLVACSAFVSFLISKANLAELLWRLRFPAVRQCARSNPPELLRPEPLVAAGRRPHPPSGRSDEP
jgi:hypothetical protein